MTELYHALSDFNSLDDQIKLVHNDETKHKANSEKKQEKYTEIQPF